MAIVALLDADAPASLQLSWAVWFARARRQALTVLATADGGDDGGRVTEQLRAQLAACGDFLLVADGDQGGEADDDDQRLRARVLNVGAEDFDAVLAQLQRAVADLLLVTTPGVDSQRPRVAAIGRQLLPRVSCAVAVVDLGDQRWPAQHLMVAASRGAHPRVALQQAQQLAKVAADGDDVEGVGRLTAAYVEPDIGSDSMSVGQHVLGRVLARAFDEDAGVEVRRRVVVSSDVERGLVKAAEVVEPDVVVMGIPRPGLLSPRFFGGVPGRLCRKVEAPVVLLRQALPLGNRLRRGLEELLQRVVPQVARESRV